MNTWRDIRDTTFQMLGDAPGRNIYFSDAQITRWANKGLRDLAWFAKYKDTEFTATVAGGSETVSIGGILRLWRGEATVAGVSQVLFPTTKDQLIHDYRRFYDIAGSVREYYVDQTRRTQSLAVGLFPKPTASTDVRFYCYDIPTEVSDLTLDDEIEIPNWAVGAVMYYILGEAYRADTTIMNKATSNLFRALYDDVRSRVADRSMNKVLMSGRRWTAGLRGTDVWARSPEFITGTV